MMLQAFRDFNRLDENVQWAKSYLTGKGIALDDEPYQVIRAILEKHPGWVGLFVRFHYEEKVSTDDLAQLFDTMMALNQSLKTLPIPVDKYTKYESLCDDLEKAQTQVKINKVYQELTAPLKAEFNQLPSQSRTQFTRVALEFMNLAQPLQKAWVKKISGFQNTLVLIQEMEAYVASCNDGWGLELIRQKVVSTQGAEVVHQDDEKRVLVVRLLTYEASAELNSGTLWCIRNSISNWNSYVNKKTTSRQYTVYDFTKRITDNDCMLGITVQLPGNPIAAHYKDDAPIKPKDYPGIIERLGIAGVLGDPLVNLEDSVSQVVDLLNAEHYVTLCSNITRFLACSEESNDWVWVNDERCTAFKVRVLIKLLHTTKAEFEGKDTFEKIELYLKTTAAVCTPKLLPLYQQLFTEMLGVIQRSIKKEGGAVYGLHGMLRPVTVIYFRALSAHDPKLLDELIALNKMVRVPINMYEIALIRNGSRSAASLLTDTEYMVAKGVPDPSALVPIQYFRAKEYDKGFAAYAPMNDREKGDLKAWKSLLSYCLEDRDAVTLKRLLTSADAMMLSVYKEILRKHLTMPFTAMTDFKAEPKLLPLLKVLTQYGSIARERLGVVAMLLLDAEETDAVTRYAKQFDYEECKYQGDFFLHEALNVLLKQLVTRHAAAFLEILDERFAQGKKLSTSVATVLAQYDFSDYVGKHIEQVDYSNARSDDKTAALALALVRGGKYVLPEALCKRVGAFEFWEAQGLTLDAIRNIEFQPYEDWKADMYASPRLAPLMPLFLEENDWALLRKLMVREKASKEPLGVSFIQRYQIMYSKAGKFDPGIMRGYIAEALEYEIPDALISVLYQCSKDPHDMYGWLVGCKLSTYLGKPSLVMGTQLLSRVTGGGDMLHFVQKIPNLMDMDITRLLRPLLDASENNAIVYLFDQIAAQPAEKRNERVISYFLTLTLTEMEADLFTRLYERFPFLHKYKGAYAAAATYALEPAIAHRLREDGAAIDHYFLCMVHRFTDEQQLRDAFKEYPVKLDSRRSVYAQFAGEYTAAHAPMLNVAIEELVKSDAGFDLTDFAVALVQVKTFGTPYEAFDKMGTFLGKFGKDIDASRLLRVANLEFYEQGDLKQKLRKLDLLAESVIRRFRDF